MATKTLTQAAQPDAMLRDTFVNLKSADHELDGAHIESELSYIIKDPKYQFEKPYTINYETDGTIPHTNASNEAKAVSVRNFRPKQSQRSFEEYGFMAKKLYCPLQGQDFDDEDKVEEHYYPAVRQILKDMYPDASAYEILEHRVRKRHSEFPIATGQNYEYFQPATLVHCDFTPDSAARTVQAAFSRSPDSYKRLIAINFWKSFSGPGNDWPLTLCHWKTVNRADGRTIMADIVFHDRFTENERAYFDPEHEWYYFKDLAADEVVAFRQCDTDIEGGGGVLHSSFFNSHAASDAPPRESIELRAFVLFNSN